MTETLALQKPKKTEKSKRSRNYALFLFFLLVVGGIFYLWRLLGGPAEGVIRLGELPAKQEAFATANEVVRYTGKYVDFSYPGFYVEKRHDLPKSGPVREVVFLSAADFEGRKIAVTVEERSDMVFESSPSFKMRLNQPKEYEKSMLTDSGFQGFLFAKTTPVYEQDAFFFEKGLLVSLAVTSPTTSQGLRDELLKVLKSVIIKNN